MNLFKNIVLYLEWSLSKEWFLLLFWPKSEGGGGNYTPKQDKLGSFHALDTHSEGRAGP